MSLPKLRPPSLVLAALLLLGLCTSLLMAEVVDEIVVEGNKKTRHEIIEQGARLPLKNPKESLKRKSPLHS